MGTLINALLIVAGGLLGLVFKKKMSQKLSENLTLALGVGILLLGLANVLVEMITIEQGVLVTKNGLLLVVSLALGTLIGSLLHIQEGMEKMENHLANKFKKNDLSKGFIEASLLYCIGAMAIIGSIADGVNGDTSILITKGIMDGVSSLILASTLGFGVVLSAIPVLLYQGLITLLASLISPVITVEVLSLISLVGFALVICIALNILKITKIKVLNMLPAMVIPILYLIIFH